MSNPYLVKFAEVTAYVKNGLLTVGSLVDDWRQEAEADIPDAKDVAVMTKVLGLLSEAESILDGSINVEVE